MLAEAPEQRLRSAADGATSADDEDDEAAALRQHAVGPRPLLHGGVVSGEALAVGVVGGDVGGAGRVEGLHVNEREGPRAVEVGEDDVRTVGEGGVTLHPLAHGTNAAPADAMLGEDTVGADGGREAAKMARTATTGSWQVAVDTGRGASVQHTFSRRVRNAEVVYT